MYYLISYKVHKYSISFMNNNSERISFSSNLLNEDIRGDSCVPGKDGYSIM